MTRLDSVQDGCWVNLTYPSEDELNTVAVTLGVEPSFLRAALDEEETSRIDRGRTDPHHHRCASRGEG